MTIIITGGLVDSSLDIGNKKTDYDRLIACDHGMDFCYFKKIKPDVIMGDFDSASTEALDYYRNIDGVELKQFPTEKDGSDTELAIRCACELGEKNIDIYGAFGSRIDHMLANIQLLKMAALEGVNLRLIDSNNIVRLLTSGEHWFSAEELFGDYISFIPFTDVVKGLSLSGFKYNLEDYDYFTGISLGVSNEVESSEVEISFDEGYLIMIESRD